MSIFDGSEKANKRIIISIILIILVLIISIVFIFINNRKKVGTISEVSEENYEYFTLHSGEENVGIINKEGKEIIPMEYAYVIIPNQSTDVFFCFTDESNYTIMNKEKEELFKEYENVSYVVISDVTMDMEKDVLTFEEEGRIGLINMEGKKIVNAIYDSITSLPNKPGFLLVKKDGLYGVLDSLGNMVIDVKYNSIKGDEYSSEKDGYLETGYIVSEKTSTGVYYGYIDCKGKLLIEPKYESITRALEYDSDDIYLICMENGKKGVLKNKKQIIKNRYQFINYSNSSKVFVVNRNGKYGFFDKQGDEILSTKYTSYTLAGNYISVKIESNMFLYDLHGNLVNTNNYRSIMETGNPSFFITTNDAGEYSIISKDVQIEEHYTNITYAFDNFFVFTNAEGKTGLLDVYSGIEIEPEYDYIIVLENGNALQAVKGNVVDIYSSTIEKTITMENAKVEKVNNEYTAIYSDYDLEYINAKGQVVSNKEVYSDKALYSYRADNGKWGFVNKNSEIKVECEYDFVTELNQYGYAAVKLDDKWGVINSEGKVIIKPTYSIETYYSPSFIDKYLLEKTEVLYCTLLEEK